jgi:hypothetical protein
MRTSTLIAITLMILTGSCATTSDDWCVLSKAEGFSGIWKPDAEVIPKLISDAKIYLEGLQKDPKTDEYQKREIEKILKWWTNYRCQIVGCKIEGKKTIHLNFFMRTRGSEQEFSYWRKSLVFVSDGGAAYWQLNYDVESGRFLRFESNGYA